MDTGQPMRCTCSVGVSRYPFTVTGESIGNGVVDEDLRSHRTVKHKVSTIVERNESFAGPGAEEDINT